MSEAPESGEKTHDPTPKKLQDARKEGNIPKSNDLSAAAAYLGLIIALTLTGPVGLLDAGAAMTGFLANPEGLAPWPADASGSTAFGHTVSGVLLPLVPLFAVPAAAVLLSLIAQQAVYFAPTKIRPKLSKVSPLAAVKNKLGPSGLFEFGKSSVKLVIVSILMVWFLTDQLEAILQTAALDPAQATAVLSSKILAFLALIFLMSLLIGGVDYLWQVADHLRKNRMSRKELEDESKEAEGDPHHKQARRQRGYEIAMNQMLSEVPSADVVIVNPTHYAVALKWDPLSGSPPVCVAKGVDEIAARIREAAQSANVPIRSDPPTARALYARIDIGNVIWPEDYQAVAAAIQFAQQMRAMARK